MNKKYLIYLVQSFDTKTWEFNNHVIAFRNENKAIEYCNNRQNEYDRSIIFNYVEVYLNDEKGE